MLLIRSRDTAVTNFHDLCESVKIQTFENVICRYLGILNCPEALICWPEVMMTLRQMMTHDERIFLKTVYLGGRKKI